MMGGVFSPSRRLLLCLIATAIVLLAASSQGRAQLGGAGDEKPVEDIQIGISVDVIPVNSDFSGGIIAVFGSIENPDRLAQLLNEYSIAVVVNGPPEDIVVRRKQRFLGIWINRDARVYRNVPSFYAVAANRPIEAISDLQRLKEKQIGIDNLSLSLLSRGRATFILPAPEFAASLRRIRQAKELFSEDPGGVTFLGSSLFRASLTIPSTVPIGRHIVTAYLFRKGEFLASRQSSFRVEKKGFEEFLHSFAMAYGLWYGMIAVLAALVTGWLASIVFAGANR